MHRKKIPKHLTISSRRDKGAKSKKRKNKRTVIRGKEVSVTENSSESQIVYGLMKVGGIVTYVDTNSDSKAYLVTGSDEDENELVWTAKTAGSSGNDISILIVNPGGTNSSTDVNVSGNLITVTLKTSSGRSTATMDNVINKIEANSTANAMVRVRKKDSTKSGKVEAFDETNLSYGGGKWLHQIITIAGHEIHSLEGLYLNNELVTFGASPDPRWGTGKWANKVFMAIQYGSDDQPAQPDLTHQKPDVWTSNHRQRGNAHIYLILVWNQNLFSDGIPEISFLIKGKKCYNPVDGVTAFTQNAALVIADYLTNSKYGLGVSWSDIDIPALIQSFYICDEEVPIMSGGTEKRYAINGVFDSSEAPSTILEQMSAAMAGDIVFQQGKWHILAGAYRPAFTEVVDMSVPVIINTTLDSIVLSELELRGTFSVSTHLSRSDTFNTVRGTYVNPNNDYKEDDIPEVTNSLYVSQDGGVKRYEDIALNFVTSSNQAQRLLKIELERIRQGITVDWAGTLSCMRFKVGDTVTLTLDRYGWSTKQFEIRQMTFVIEPDGSMGVDMHLRETAAAIFSWSLEETTVDLSPNTDLPDPTDSAAPSNLTLTSGTSELYRRNDGTIFSRLKVSWDVSTSEFVTTGGFYEIEYKKSSDSSWSTAGQVPGDQTFFHILDVQDGVSYDVRVRSVNTLRYKSDFTTVTGHIVVGKTEPPSDVTNFNAVVSDLGIKFNWDSISDLDVAFYEIREGTVWETATVIARTRSSSGNTFNYEVLTGGTHYFLIKAIDTTGNYSSNAKSVSTTIIGPNPIQNFTVKTATNFILLDWQDPLPSTLSVNKYYVYKGGEGDDFEDADLIGTVFGTFHSYIENFGGTFSYWVVAVDIGGNTSTPVLAVATIVPSNDFVIHDDLLLYDSLDSNTYSTLDDANSRIIAPTKTASETWADHFENNSFTTIQDFIDAGYINRLEPSDNTNPAVIIFKVDYGVTFPSIYINFSWLETVLNGTCTVTPQISVSEDDISYTDFSSSQVFAEDVRYVKYQLTVETDTNDMDLVRLSAFRAILQVQRIEETQIVTTDGSGFVQVDFENTFLDVEDIQVSVNSSTTALVYYDYDFSNVPADQSVDVYTVDIDGDPLASKQVTVRIKGIIGG